MELNYILLSFVMVLCVYALINGKKANTPQINIKNNYYYLAVGLIFLVAIFLRAYKLDSIPAGINQDGAMAAVDAAALAKYGTDRFGMSLPAHFTAWGYGQMSVLLSYLMVPFIWIFGLNPLSARLPMLIASIIAIYILFRFILKTFGKTPALIALIFIAINPWQIMQSRWALDCNLLPHFLLFSVYALYLGIANKKRLFLYGSMVLFALTMYTYGIAIYAIPLILIALCIYLLVKKLVKVPDILICAGIYLLFAWPMFAMVAINFFGLDTLHVGPFTIAYFPESVRTNDILLFSDNFFAQLISNFMSMLDVVFLQNPDLPWNTISEYGIMYLFTLPFTVTGIVFTWRRLKEASATSAQKAGRMFLILWMGVALLSGLIINNVNVNRINIIMYPMAIFTALGIYYALFEAIGKKAITIMLSVVFAFSALSFSINYFGQHKEDLAPMFFDGFGSAVEYAEDLNTDKVYVTAYTQYEGAKHVSEILTMFYADIDAQYYQGKKSTDGNRKLPYKERYSYCYFGAHTEPEKDVAYVFNADEANLFDPGVYDIKMFAGYGVAVAK